MYYYKLVFKTVIISLIVLTQIIQAEPTGRTYIFAASHYMFYHPALESLARHFDVIVFHDWNRDTIPTLRDTAEVTWRRDKAPLLLLYKDAMTLIGPQLNQQGDTTYWGDIPRGGRETVGGYYHFDSIFKNEFLGIDI